MHINDGRYTYRTVRIVACVYGDTELSASQPDSTPQREESKKERGREVEK